MHCHKPINPPKYLHLVLQVMGNEIDAAQWLHEAVLTLPGLCYLPIVSQAVSLLVDVVCSATALCSTLHGCHNSAASFINSLINSQVPQVRAGACKALAGAVYIGPSAKALSSRPPLDCASAKAAPDSPLACGSAISIASHDTVLQAVVRIGLASDDSKQFAAQVLQAIVHLGSDEQRTAVSAWMVWLTCFDQDHDVGGVISSLTNYLQSWR